MSEEEDLAAIESACASQTGKLAGILAALPSMTGKQKQETREWLESAQDQIQSACEAAGVAA